MLNQTTERYEPVDPSEMTAGTPTRVMRAIWSFYAIGLVLTFILQLVIRLNECTGLGACGISLMKAVPWSVLWPFYWMFYFNS
jgi:hypothetical protein